VYALYLRVRPWRRRAVDVQAGLVPPVFGGFPRHGYGNDPALIGYPLAYQYATLVRPDAAPVSVENLQRWRGRGGWVLYPTGTRSYDHGLPLVSGVRWDAGVQAQVVAASWELSAAVTQGTLGHPLVSDDNASKQVSGRVAWRPLFGLTLGASAARGGYVSRTLLEAVPAAGGRDFRQRAAGADVEYARGHWIFRGEGVWSGWDALSVSPALLGRNLAARAVSVEGRYRPWPGVTVAARLEHLDFGDLPGGSTSWDAPVSRAEVGAGYALRRNLSVKVAYQYNRRDATAAGWGPLATWPSRGAHGFESEGAGRGLRRVDAGRARPPRAVPSCRIDLRSGRAAARAVRAPAPSPGGRARRASGGGRSRPAAGRRLPRGGSAAGPW
jgi:hypothetical protein